MTDYSWMKPGVKAVADNYRPGDEDPAHGEIYILCSAPFTRKVAFDNGPAEVWVVKAEGIHDHDLSCKYLKPYKEDGDKLKLKEGSKDQKVSWGDLEDAIGFDIRESETV